MPIVAKKLFIALALFITSIAVGVGGYTLIENYTLVDALYMTVITISTVGFREVLPLSDAGKLFTAVYIIFNLVFLSYRVANWRLKIGINNMDKAIKLSDIDRPNSLKFLYLML